MDTTPEANHVASRIANQRTESTTDWKVGNKDTDHQHHHRTSRHMHGNHCRDSLPRMQTHSGHMCELLPSLSPGSTNDIRHCTQSTLMGGSLQQVPLLPPLLVVDPVHCMDAPQPPVQPLRLPNVSDRITEPCANDWELGDDGMDKQPHSHNGHHPHGNHCRDSRPRKQTLTGRAHTVLPPISPDSTDEVSRITQSTMMPISPPLMLVDPFNHMDTPVPPIQPLRMPARAA
jgi:hypothetical protein